MKCARYRRGGQRENIGVETEPFQAFLVFDTEAMLLVNDNQSELRERHVGAQKAMRADNHVDLSRLEISENRRLLFRRLKATQGFDVHREIRQTFAERP